MASARALPSRLAGQVERGPRSLTARAVVRLIMSKHLREIFSSAPLPHPLSFGDFGNSNLATKCPRVDSPRPQVPERPPSQETKAALIGVPTLSLLFCRGRRLPMIKDTCSDQNGSRAGGIACANQRMQRARVAGICGASCSRLSRFTSARHAALRNRSQATRRLINRPTRRMFLFIGRKAEEIMTGSISVRARTCQLSLVEPVIPGRRSEAEACPESILSDL
jgi:hypothetical protein